MNLLLPLIVALAPRVTSPQEPNAPIPAATQGITVEAIDTAIRRAARYLRMQQQEDGSFSARADHGVCTVALTAMALWSLNEPEPRVLDAPDVDRAARFLLAHHHPDGGIYDPAHGLPIYTSGVAARALRTLGKRESWPELSAAVADVELFTYRRATPESIVDIAPDGATPIARSAEVARTLLTDAPKTDDAKRKALEFLAHCERDTVRAPARVRTPPAARNNDGVGSFSYDDLLPFVYFDLAPEQQLALRARAALHAYYTPDRNPDLTKRYGAAGFMPGTQGLFYYYFVVAKTLNTFGERTLVTADGQSHDWPDEVATRLVRAQLGSGEWVNTDAGWWEDEPVLATSYAILTLKLCRVALTRAAAKR